VSIRCEELEKTVGEPRLFEEFVAGSVSGLLRFAYLLAGDGALAEDLVQEGLIKAQRAWGDIAAVDQPTAYVRRIILNEFTDWRRRRWSTELVGRVPDHRITDVTDDVAQRDLVWRVLTRLSRRQRAVLVLRYYEGMSDEDIGMALECSEGTVRSLAARAFKRLRRNPSLAEEAGGRQAIRAKEEP
jgi:RNA polymerase sigma-70 factor (sigma-E family)